MLMPPRSETNDNHNNNNNTSSGTGAVHTTVAAHTKMRLLSKVEQNMRQQQSQNPNHSVKQLITTAATGNGVVGDVDGLLVPMRSKQNGQISAPIVKDSRPERNLWSRAEMLEMLQIMQQLNALELLNDRNIRSESIFREIEKIMHSKGFVKKTSVQIWTKWKFLKSTYNTTTRQGQGIIPKVVPEEVFRVLCKMLRGSCNYDDDSECDNSNYSMEESNEMSKERAGSSENEGPLGMEHPIFGFRLGPIKPEPVDTGYETAINQDHDNNSEQDSLEHSQHEATNKNLDHTPFIVSVKHEPDLDLTMEGNGTNTPPPTAPASPSPPLNQTIEYRDTMITSTPQMPPLRVASFAKDAQRQNTHGVLHIDRPPMPQIGSKSSSIKGIRAQPLPGSSNFAQPNTKLMLPKLAPTSQQRPQMPVRIPREISVQPTSARNAAMNGNSNLLRLKQVPLRNTPYSLRPERMIPNLDHCNSPPQSPSPTSNHQPVPTILTRAQPHMQRSDYPMYGNPAAAAASTSRQAQMEAQMLQMRKRRAMETSHPVPVKLQRSMGGTPKSMAPLYDPSAEMHGGIPSDEEHFGHSKAMQRNSKLAAEAEKRKQEFFYEKEREDLVDQQRNSKLTAEADKRRQEQFFEKELSDLADALRTAQSKMLKDFFVQQKELVRREHEFQMRQDTIILRALRKQTNALMRTANDLMKQTEKVEEIAEADLKDEEEGQRHEEHNSVQEPQVELQIGEAFSTNPEVPQTVLSEEDEPELVEDKTEETDGEEGLEQEVDETDGEDELEQEAEESDAEGDEDQAGLESDAEHEQDKAEAELASTVDDDDTQQSSESEESDEAVKQSTNISEDGSS